MNKFNLKKALAKNDVLNFKSNSSCDFKVFLTSDSYSITRKIGNEWRYHCGEHGLLKHEVSTIALNKILEIIETL
jgi:hypothetical protein